MMRRLAVRRETAGVFALSLGILLTGWALLLPRQARAQDAAPTAPAAPAGQPAAQDTTLAAPPAYAHWAEDLAAWRAAREREIGAPDGWLTLAGMEWLNPGVNSFGAAKDNQIRVHAQAPDHMGLLTVSANRQKGKQPGASPRAIRSSNCFLRPEAFRPI